MYVNIGENWTYKKSYNNDINTEFLKKKKIKKIIVEIKSFFNAENTYKNYDTNNCFTMVFHGQPGNGKYSSIEYIVKELNLSLFSLRLNTIKNVNTLINLLTRVHKNSIVVIENIDVKSFNISRNTFINLLDGIFTKNRIMFILTCVNLKNLKNIRVDNDFEFKNANYRIAEKMFLSFYPGKKAESKSFSSHIRNNLFNVSISSVKEYFTTGKKRNAQQASQEVKKYNFKKHKIKKYVI